MEGEAGMHPEITPCSDVEVHDARCICEARTKNWKEAMRILRNMQVSPAIAPDVITYSACTGVVGEDAYLHAIKRLGSLCACSRKMILAYGTPLGVVVMLIMWCFCDKTPGRKYVCGDARGINVCGDAKQWQQALDLLDEMQALKVPPTGGGGGSDALIRR